MADARIADALARLPDYFGNHILVSVTALALGLAASLPLALISYRRPALRAGLLAATSIVQTIPGLALLALFYPFAWSGGAIGTCGVGFSALGFLPAVLAPRSPLCSGGTKHHHRPDEHRSHDRWPGVGMTERSRCGWSSCPWRCPSS